MSSGRGHRRLLTGLLVALLCLGGVARADDAAWLPRHPDTDLRLVVWNVDREFLAQNADFQRVLRAIDADLLILDEMQSETSAARIAAGLPRADAPWHVLYGEGGGAHQRASIAARVPLERLAQFDEMPYPPDRFDEWLVDVPEQHRRRARSALESGVAAVGGVASFGERRVLVVALDLQCCGHEKDSVEELRRRFETTSIRTAIDAVAKATSFDAVLVGGDFNTVSGDTPIRIVSAGATSATSLAIVDARHRDGTTTWTWDGRGTPFPSRRIDYALHSPQLVVLQSQVFDTEDLDAEAARRLQLPSELSGELSPHRPVVVDLAWRM
jgi:endonuclease/exonuclease/phosphatase family metal-dependent hydrolase